MPFDLNIAWSPSTNAADLERTLRFGGQLGYKVVALNCSLEAPLKAQVSNVLPKYPTQRPEEPNEDTRWPLPTVLHRATITFSDPAHNPQLAKAAATYDILALRPTTEKAFQAACLNIQEASIISLDLTNRLPFYLKPKPCMAAVNRGVRFEISYGAALAPAADARARANLAGNVAQLVRATRGRGLILSSEASSVMGLRGPADVINLLAIWGLPRDKGMEALNANPRGVVVNEGIKRSGFRGVVDIVNVAERPEGEEQKKSGMSTAGPTGDPSRKRKNGQGVTIADGGEGDQPLSKRQAKKLKAAQRKKEAQEKGAQP
ncbi:PHP domain-like protein [Hypoxylon fuscum]|nr:PHP domain-like protein [Hypoxylon fuscum]